MSSGFALYRRLLRYVRPYWWAFGIALVGMVIVAAGDTVMAYMVMPIIQKFVDRLSTIERVHRIVVLDAGRVAEQGTHAELIARDGLYAKLHHIQFAAATADA